MTKQEIIKKLEKAIKNCEQLKFALSDSDNPQIKETRAKAEAKQEAFEAVLLAMRGDSIYLNLEAR